MVSYMTSMAPRGEDTRHSFGSSVDTAMTGSIYTRTQSIAAVVWLSGHLAAREAEDDAVRCAAVPRVLALRRRRALSTKTRPHESECICKTQPASTRLPCATTIP